MKTDVPIKSQFKLPEIKAGIYKTGIYKTGTYKRKI